MTSRDFCFWLQGYFEINDAAHVGSTEITRVQGEMIRKHLNMVFLHEIDPSYGDAKHQEKLNQAHAGEPVKTAGPNYTLLPGESPKIRC